MTRKEQIKQVAKKYVKGEPEGEQKIIGMVGFEFGAEWADETMIDKACEWLSDNLWIYLDDMLKPRDGYEKLESDFRKAMEE